MEQIVQSVQREYTPLEYTQQERMIFVRITYTLSIMIRAPIIAICFLLIAMTSFVHHSYGVLRILDFTIYTDGTTHVFYQTEVDPLEPDVTIKLFGNTIDNFVARDENDFLLSSKIDTNSVVIETLGASTIKIDYDTADLVTKNGKIWSFNIDAPFDYSILLPKNTVIVGMNTYPLNMQIVDEQSLISLPSGAAEISYVFGVLGTAQTATLAIEKAQALINQINTERIETPMASTKLAEALAAFEEDRFSSAEILANEAKNIATQEQQTALSNLGSTSNNSLTSIGSTIVGVAATIGTVAGAVVTVALLLKRAKSAVKKTAELLSKDTNYVPPAKETIFRLKPDLRQEDKDIVTFISENGGQVYESELRKKFLLPRTTTWRAVKRLEREGIVEIDKVDQQNRIRLRKTLEENQE
ncbi:MAG: helix-turn-helix transcriptional regulator [Nitrososphaerota archaeon]